jgi:hypothetical protein
MKSQKDLKISQKRLFNLTKSMLTKPEIIKKPKEGFLKSLKI